MLNFGGSFGYFDEEDSARVAASAYRALRPGGRFLIDVSTTENILPRFRERSWFTTREFVVLTENRFDHETGRIEGDWTIVAPDGRRETIHRSGSTRSRSSCVNSAERGSPTSRGSHAANLEPFALGASRLMLVATKK